MRLSNHSLRVAACRALFLIIFAAQPGITFCQSTQGLIAGRVFALKNGAGIPGASVFCTNIDTAEVRNAPSDKDGKYTLVSMSPGEYSCRAAVLAGNGNPITYQPRDTNELHLPVAGRLDLDFPLRALSDVYDQGIYSESLTPDSDAIVRNFAADARSMRSAPLIVLQGQIGALETSISQIIYPRELNDLPLAGRDAYTLLITQPGVTDDSATARSLGLSANGQRPSASNFLLDGLENNNSLLSGPLTVVPPEALQEYRISTTMYSAEYGRTSGYLANAVTRAGTNQWHGLGYFDLENDVLNANDFQNNRQGFSRIPLKQSQPGFSLGGPLRKNHLYSSMAFEYLRFRSASQPVDLRLPTTSFQPSPGSIAQELLTRYPAPIVNAGTPTAYQQFSPPTALERYSAIPRLDYQPGREGQRFMARLALEKDRRPDYVWTPYPDFVMPLTSGAISLATGWTWFRPSGFTEELRGGWSGDDLRFDRPNSEIPTLVSDDGTILPGSPALYGFRNRDHNVEIVENLTWVHSRHSPKIGAGILFRRIDGYLTIGRDRVVYFDNAAAFAADQVSQIDLATPRSGCSLVCQPGLPLPDYNRQYSQNEFYAFAQDSWKITPRLVVNFGVRYDNFGAPRNTGPMQDARLILGNGTSFAQRLETSNIDYPQTGHLKLYDSDNADWGARAGFSWSLNSASRTVLRGGFGTFYDRPFDNEWENLRNNSVAYATGLLQGAPARTNYLTPPGPSNPFGAAFSIDSNFSRLTLYQPGIRSPYAENFFLGVRQQLADNLWLEVNGLGSLGRRLITTDVLNRQFSTGPYAFYQPLLPPIYYRANQGASSDYALTSTLGWRARFSEFQVSWTWSHSIDNQSEPLNGDYYNLVAVSSLVPQAPVLPSSFTRQFDSGSDRGNSDFDQRHSVVFFSIWDLPSFLRNWKVSQLAAFRSGLPFSVIGAMRGETSLFNDRANLTDPSAVYINVPAPDQGGEVLLNKAAFMPAASNVIGDTGRNEFRAPGFYDIDFSLSRSFALSRFGEATRFVIRADAFNLLNHANLGTPNFSLNATDFGVAMRGRQGISTGFPAEIPFQETARLIQLIVRLQW